MVEQFAAIDSTFGVSTARSGRGFDEISSRSASQASGSPAWLDSIGVKDFAYDWGKKNPLMSFQSGVLVGTLS
jgi:hypothetical protein